MATKRWLGSAQDIQQHETYTFTGTWAANDTCSLKINNKVLTLTLGTDVATTDVAAEVAAMINALNATAGRTGANQDETRNFGGQQIPEWTEVVATVSGSVMTLKSTAGVPVTVTCTQNTAGNGAIEGATDNTYKSGTTVTAATGKNFFNNAANWEGGVMPATTETALFDQGDVDVKYGLNVTGTIVDLHLIRTNGYKGNIGLPAVNSLGYTEYRPRYLVLDGAVIAQNVIIGDSNPLMSPMGHTYIDFGASPVGPNVTVYDAPAASSSTGYPVQIIEGHEIVLKAYSGGVAVGADLATVDESTIFSAEVHGDASVCLLGITYFQGSATLTQTGGLFKHLGANNAIATANIRGGESLLMDVAITTLNIYAGATVTYSSVLSAQTATTVNVFSGGTLTEDTGAATITNLKVHRGCTLRHPRQNFTLTNGIDFVGCKPTEITWDAPTNLTWTSSTI